MSIDNEVYSDEASDDGRFRVVVTDRHKPPRIAERWSLRQVYDSVISDALRERAITVWVFETTASGK